MERTKCVRVQAGIRVCVLSVYVVYVPGLFIKLSYFSIDNARVIYR